MKPLASFSKKKKKKRKEKKSDNKSKKYNNHIIFILFIICTVHQRFDFSNVIFREKNGNLKVPFGVFLVFKVGFEKQINFLHGSVLANRL